MFEDALELAENKLLILYIFSKFDIPVSNNQITDIILENNLINYFTLQQNLTELISANFLKYINKENNHKISITQKGCNVLLMFIDRVSEEKLNIIDEYLKNKLNLLQKELSIISDYTTKDKDTLMVNLKAVKDDLIIIDIKVSVDSKEKAKKMCSKWQKNSSELYLEILDILNSD